MTEQEYIIATDLAKLRIAKDAIADTMSVPHNPVLAGDVRLKLIRSLSDLIEAHYKAVHIQTGETA